ncbi:MAG TPA: SIMPL domain-containing protein [Pararobbsia sp.]|nr:SIMPL domain-containing protein [Pararobbsia sp.]
MLTSATVSAQMMPPPAGVLNLDASASADIPQDVVHITLAYEQQSDDPAALANALNERTEQVLAAAKRQAGVTAQTGALTVYPSTDNNGHISGWRGRSEVRLDSRDFAAASKLAGSLSSQMQVANVTFSLAPETRDAAQAKLSGQAIAAFRQKAATASTAFGFGGYTIREVSVSGGESAPPRPMMMRMAAAPSAKVADMPIEGGNSTVTVNVNGSVQMTR